MKLYEVPVRIDESWWTGPGADESGHYGPETVTSGFVGYLMTFEDRLWHAGPGGWTTMGKRVWHQGQELTGGLVGHTIGSRDEGSTGEQLVVREEGIEEEIAGGVRVVTRQQTFCGRYLGLLTRIGPDRFVLPG